MSGELGRYLLSVSAASMLLCVGQALLPNGAVRRIAAFAGGILVVLAVMSPIIDIDYNHLLSSFEQFEIERGEIKTDSIAVNRSLMTDIIKERCRTYILDKARDLGAELTVEVSLSEDEVYPLPVHVILTGSATVEQQKKLSECIAEDMGIPVQRQEWNIR